VRATGARALPGTLSLLLAGSLAASAAGPGPDFRLWRTGAPPAETPAAGAPPAALLALTDQVLPEVSRLRGLDLLGPVAREVHDEATLRSYVSRRLEEEYPGDRLKREERLLLALGLLPPGSDLERAIGDLYAAQTAGYYDPARRTLYLSETLPEMMQRPTLVHELTHALQDQHFKIARFMDPRRTERNDDASLAVSALIEGDATGVMLSSLTPPGGAGLWPGGLSFFDGDLLESLTAAQSPGAPAFLVQVLGFPYKYGTRFVARLYSQGGWEAVNAAYARPPRSSEQVLHPERYAPLEDPPRHVAEAVLPAALGGLSRNHDLVLGEFVTRLVLEPGVGQERAGRAADGWDGDRAALYVGAGAELVVWLSVWDSPQEASEFAAAVGDGGAGGRLTETRGERVLHLRGGGTLPGSDLPALADALWKGWR